VVGAFRTLWVDVFIFFILNIRIFRIDSLKDHLFLCIDYELDIIFV